MNVSKYGVQHTVVMTMLLIALGVFGLISITSLNIEFVSQDINMPQVYVLTIYPGASAEDVEETVINVMEGEFVTLPNFSSMTSQALNSMGVIIIEFSSDVSAEDQIDEVRNRIDDLMDDLPAGIEKPSVLLAGSSMLPVMSFIVEGGDDIGAISQYIEDDIKPELTRISGVSEIEVEGGVTPVLEVRLRTEDLDSKGVSPLMVYQLLSYSNSSLPLGNVQSGDQLLSLRFDGSFGSLEDVRLLPLGANDNGDIIRLQDVADVGIIAEESDYDVFAEGRDVVVVNVFKRSDGNTYRINRQIREVLDEAERKTGGALSFSIVSDDTKVINASMTSVLQSGAMGVVIAILVIFLFLNDLRATLIIGASIPLSVFFAFIGMKVAGISINLLSLSGIVIALGSIVDASIVVLDQIYRFYKSGEDGKAEYTLNESIYRGTAVVDKSVIGSNLTTSVVYIPLILISGLVGTILHDISLTILFAIFSSLFVAIIFVPYLCKKFLKDDSTRLQTKDSITVRGLKKVEKGYQRVLGSCLNHTPFVVVLCLMVLVITGYTITQMEFAFIPSTDNSEFYVAIQFPAGYTEEQTRADMAKVEEVMKATVPELEAYVIYSGSSTDNFSFSQDKNQGGVHGTVVPVKQRDRGTMEIIRALQYDLAKVLPGAEVSCRNGGFDYLVGYMSDGGGYGLTLIGTDKDLLFSEAERLKAYLLTDPEVMSVSINSSFDSRTSVIAADSESLSAVGLTAYEASMATAILFNGVDIPSVYTEPETGKRYDIKLTSDVAERKLDEDMFSSIKLITSSGTAVPIDSVASITQERSLSQINHSNRSVSMTVSAQVTGESVTGVEQRMAAYLAGHPLAEGIDTEAGGLGSLVEESIGPVMQALAIAMFLVLAIIVIIYERFDQPFLIMLLCPFCIIGVTISLVLFGSTVNMVSLMGVITLVGMLVNNGIILVDSINQLMQKSRLDYVLSLGMKYETGDNITGYMGFQEEMKVLKRNIASASTSRLRPILMSALTTILGVVPLAFTGGEGSEIYAPLGQVIMGGLATSTFLTLFLMPVFYFILERHKIKKAAKTHETKTEEIE